MSVCEIDFAYDFFAVAAWRATALIRSQLEEALLSRTADSARIARALLHRDAGKQDRRDAELATILVEDGDEVGARLEWLVSMAR